MYKNSTNSNAYEIIAFWNVKDMPIFMLMSTMKFRTDEAKRKDINSPPRSFIPRPLSRFWRSGVLISLIFIERCRKRKRPLKANLMKDSGTCSIADHFFFPLLHPITVRVIELGEGEKLALRVTWRQELYHGCYSITLCLAPQWIWHSFQMMMMIHT